MRPLLTLVFMCFAMLAFFSGTSVADNSEEDYSSLSEQVILKHINIPKGLTCRIVAKQKIFDGNYKVYYITTLPDGTEELDSINLLQVEQDDWIVSDAG
ncbi:MAG: hypothetical protein KJ737_22420 [Proteobacteria bacterium]|nr:hypothetical protein [Pseudomonadota bacterium]